MRCRKLTVPSSGSTSHRRPVHAVPPASSDEHAVVGSVALQDREDRCFGRPVGCRTGSTSPLNSASASPKHLGPRRPPPSPQAAPRQDRPIRPRTRTYRPDGGRQTAANPIPPLRRASVRDPLPPPEGKGQPSAQSAAPRGPYRIRVVSTSLLFAMLGSDSLAIT